MKDNVQKNTTALPLVNFPPAFETVVNEVDMVANHPDSLARMEEKSVLYKNYRQMCKGNIKCGIIIHYKTNNIPRTTKIELILELFNGKRTLVFDFDKHFKYVNDTLREKFLTDAILKTMDEIKFTRADMVVFKNVWGRIKEKITTMNSGEWGGLITFQRHEELRVITPFHNKNNLETIQAIALAENVSEGPLILQQAFRDIFFGTRIEQIEFDDTLSTLYGVDSLLNFNSDNDFDIPLHCNYFKCARRALYASFNQKPFSLSVMTLCDQIQSYDPVESVFRSETENFFFLKAEQNYRGDEGINLYYNEPKLIFVVGNFVQHSLYGSRQEKILNFFPMDHRKDDILYHNFINPIRLKVNQEPNFHITLLDQDLKPLKAGVGIATLLNLKKTQRSNMFPVTIVSSDAENLKLYPSNAPNHFTNKLSMPLLFPNRKNWTVSLRCIAFPKICNISPEICFLYLQEMKDGYENDVAVHVELQASYISNIHSLVSLINKSIQSTLSKRLTEQQAPQFEMLDEKVVLTTNNFQCILSKGLMRILGMTHSFLESQIIYPEGRIIESVARTQLFLYQPKEIIATSNIVEESFYAQSRPNILRVIPVREQKSSIGSYNFIEFQEQDNIRLSINRIQDIEIKLHTRKGDLVNFIEENDVKIQLEFKEGILS